MIGKVISTTPPETANEKLWDVVLNRVNDKDALVRAKSLEIIASASKNQNQYVQKNLRATFISKARLYKQFDCREIISNQTTLFYHVTSAYVITILWWNVLRIKPKRSE